MSRTLLIPLGTLLNNVGKKKDATGKYIDSPIFPENDLLEFLKVGEQSVKSVLKAVNVDVVLHYPDLVVEYAFAMALMSKSLIEKGREFAVHDNGVFHNPPNVSDHLVRVANMTLDNWHRKVNLVRA